MKFAIAQIKTPWQRRACLIAIAPAVFIYLLPEIIAIVGSSIAGAWEGFAEEWTFQMDSGGARLIKHTWARLWSPEWKAEA